MTIRKIQECNRNSSLSVVIPSEYCKQAGLSGKDFVNIELVGNTLHMTKVVLQ